MRNLTIIRTDLTPKSETEYQLRKASIKLDRNQSLLTNTELAVIFWLNLINGLTLFKEEGTYRNFRAIRRNSGLDAPPTFQEKKK